MMVSTAYSPNDVIPMIYPGIHFYGGGLVLVDCEIEYGDRICFSGKVDNNGLKIYTRYRENVV